MLNFFNITHDLDHGYANLQIDTTTPKIGDTIEPDTKFLSIKYYNQVDLSKGNITIFQKNDRKNIRQIIPGTNDEYIDIIDDGNGTTVNVKIIESTFNQFGGRYYVSIDNNFVKSRIFQEPLRGLNEDVWSFTIRKYIENLSLILNEIELM